MKIWDLMVYLPRGILTTITKWGRAEIDQIGKKQILENGLYHLTSD